jgi:hypothetical protein
MASTITLKQATPHRLKYELTYDGSTDPFLAQTVMAAQAVPGPLKDLLSQVYSAGAWNALPDGDKLSLYTSARSSSVGAKFEQAGPNVMKLYGCGIGTSMVEVAFLHSASR